MKKLFYVLVISAAFAACNNEAKSDKAADTTAVAPAATDAAPATTAPADTTHAAPAATDAPAATTAK